MSERWECPFCLAPVDRTAPRVVCCDRQRREMDRYTGMVQRLQAEHAAPVRLPEGEQK